MLPHFLARNVNGDIENANLRAAKANVNLSSSVNGLSITFILLTDCITETLDHEYYWSRIMLSHF
jgi:hypothetical protein